MCVCVAVSWARTFDAFEFARSVSVIAVCTANVSFRLVIIWCVCMNKKQKASKWTNDQHSRTKERDRKKLERWKKYIYIMIQREKDVRKLSLDHSLRLHPIIYSAETKRIISRTLFRKLHISDTHRSLVNTFISSGGGSIQWIYHFLSFTLCVCGSRKTRTHFKHS